MNDARERYLLFLNQWGPKSKGKELTVLIGKGIEKHSKLYEEPET